MKELLLVVGGVSRNSRGHPKRKTGEEDSGPGNWPREEFASTGGKRPTARRNA